MRASTVAHRVAGPSGSGLRVGFGVGRSVVESPAQSHLKLYKGQSSSFLTKAPGNAEPVLGLIGSASVSCDGVGRSLCLRLLSLYVGGPNWPVCSYVCSTSVECYVKVSQLVRNGKVVEKTTSCVLIFASRKVSTVAARSAVPQIRKTQRFSTYFINVRSREFGSGKNYDWHLAFLSYFGEKHQNCLCYSSWKFVTVLSWSETSLARSKSGSIGKLISGWKNLAIHCHD